MRSFTSILALVLFMGCSTAPMRTLAEEMPPENPWDLMNQISDGDYFDATAKLKRFEKHYLDSTQRWSYLQALATTLSYVGQYGEAQRSFDLDSNNGSSLDAPGNLSSYEAVDAVAALTELAKSNQVIMLNEAHHVPETRGITTALLKPLYDQGFRYFAAETLNEYGVAQAVKKGCPVRSAGYYAVEPLVADIVREALKVGFKIVAYEYSAPCDYGADPTGCQDKRERGQARNLVDRILKDDPAAKILIHAGYGHIDETGVSHSLPWIPMAKYFRDFSGINPLTVDQTEFRSRSREAVETRGYRTLIEHFKPNAPVFLKDRKTKAYWTGMKGHYDIQVVLPESPRGQGRPDWLNALTHRRVTAVSSASCQSFPCLVQAVLNSEVSQPYVPFDQVYLDSQQTQRVSLNLKPGAYVLRYVSGDAVREDLLEVQE